MQCKTQSRLWRYTRNAGAPATLRDQTRRSDDGRIARIGRVDPSDAARTIDADGRVVCPGFIDMHTHSDVPLLKDGDAQSKVRQGVTLDVIGESTTVAPLIGPAAEEFHRELRHRDGF